MPFRRPSLLAEPALRLSSAGVARVVLTSEVKAVPG